jgi:nicotinate-nucleotide pyrophosphorylase (carboxylating)
MVEATNLEEIGALLSLAADIQPDRILLDNMTREEMTKAVDLIRTQTQVQDGAIEIEATGGITLANVRGVAETGVDLISIGALTHSAPALDMSLLLD